MSMMAARSTRQSTGPAGKRSSGRRWRRRAMTTSESRPQRPMIEVRKLVKTFGGKPVLRGLDFSVPEGDFVAVVGPNGAGKTTLLRILASLARPPPGAGRLAGRRLPAEAGAGRRILGGGSHQPLLYGGLTAEENL